MRGLFARLAVGIVIAATILFLFVAAAGFVRFNFTNGGDVIPGVNAPDTPACTMDANLCPDGTTYVSRQGPNCEFAPCPAVVVPIAN